MKLLTSFAILLFFSVNSSIGQKLVVFDEMRKTVPDIFFVKDYGLFETERIDEALSGLKHLSFSKVTESTFHSSKDHKISSKLSMVSWKNAQNALTLQVLSGPQTNLLAAWEEIGKTGTYSGWSLGPGNFYLRADSVENNIINILFKNDTHIFSLHSQLPFPTLAMKENRKASEDEIIRVRLESMNRVMNALATGIVPEKFSIYRPGDALLTSAERIYGFTHFWTEVKYNFAFFDQVPDLDWDEVYREYLPAIMKEQSNTSYFNLLERICALLEDGHTNIFPPNQSEYDYPAISLKRIEGKAIVQNMAQDLTGEIQKGAEIISVDGIAVEPYVIKYVRPYISSSTDYIRNNEGIRKMLKGKTGTEVTLVLKNPDGLEKQLVLRRTRDTEGIEWALPWPQRERLEFKALEKDVAYIALNGFGSSAIVQDFEAILDSLTSYDYFIIDLRNNGGGNSGYGYDILKYFAERSFRTSKWSTREHLASFKAWGNQYAKTNDSELGEWELKAKKINLGKYWHVSESDTMDSEKKIDFKGELIVLIGNNTASAAEDFLIALDDLGIGKLVGEPTYGSTGQPLPIKLPRGGTARICTKKDTYPDGREFVGYGITPDISIPQTLDDFINDRDRVLEEVIKLLRK